MYNTPQVVSSKFDPVMMRENPPYNAYSQAPSQGLGQGQGQGQGGPLYNNAQIYQSSGDPFSQNSRARRSLQHLPGNQDSGRSVFRNIGLSTLENNYERQNYGGQYS